MRGGEAAVGDKARQQPLRQGGVRCSHSAAPRRALPRRHRAPLAMKPMGLGAVARQMALMRSSAGSGRPAQMTREKRRSVASVSAAASPAGSTATAQ